jgi:ferredoxin-type protein NapH
MRRHRSDIAPLGNRLKIQLWSLVAFNSYFLSPKGKYLCLPVLNCYACPVGAVSCPVGSLTAFALFRQIPYYIIGFLGLSALAVGRGFCGWACPFGLLQDALYRTRTRKLRLPRAVNALKYVLLVVLVIGLPFALGSGRNNTGTERIVADAAGGLDYCALVCPVGTLEAGVPGLLVNSDLRERASWRTVSKLAILVIVLGLMVVSRRSFCRALCPVGAVMSLGSRISLFQLRTDTAKCTRCMRCVRVCPTASRLVPAEPGEKDATAECVLCLDCVRACPEAGALSARLGSRTVALSQGKDDD